MKMAEMVSRLKRATEERDTATGDQLVDAIRRFTVDHPEEMLSTEMVEAVANYLCLPRENQEENPAVVSDPDSHIYKLLSTLADEDWERAQHLMGKLYLSWHIGGPSPSDAGAARLLHAMVNPVWDSRDHQPEA
tara:strand:- start:387 stop:788 length:402 start_codon:yes stop_codon:yes gene_type:complete